MPGAAFWALWTCFLLLHLAGFRRDLPYTPEINEPAYVARALAVAATRGLDSPLAQPAAATVVYPLAVAYKISAKLFHTGLALGFLDTDAFYYYIGRAWSVIFSLLSLILLYWLGARAFSPGIGLLAAGLYTGYVLPVTSAQLVQSDSLQVFLTLAFFWSLQRGQEQPGRGWPLLSGLAMGLAAATHYALGVFLVVFIAARIQAAIRDRRSGGDPRTSWQALALGLGAAALVYLALQPMWLRDFSATGSAFLAEARQTYGAGSLARWWENLLWVLTRALRWNMGGLQIQLALVWLLWWRRNPRAWLLRVGSLVWLFWAGLAAAPAQAWINPVLPLLALGCADLAAAVWAWCVRSARADTVPGRWILGAALLLVLAGPVLWAQVNTQWRLAHYSSRITSRNWILAHLPAGSRIAMEWLTAPLRNDEKQFTVREENRLANHPLDEYRRQGFTYFLVSDWISGALWKEGAPAGGTDGFGRELSRQAELLRLFEPAPWQTGPAIAIYRLRAAPDEVQP